METALTLVLEDSDSFDAVRREFARDQVERGIPFHITVLYPFAPREELTTDLLDEVRALFAAREPLEFSLVGIETFPAVVYATPEPVEPLRGCIRSVYERFPTWPPYGGVHPDVIPHATLATDVDGEQVRHEIDARLAAQLPRAYRIEEVTLLEEFEADRWRERERFPLRG